MDERIKEMSMENWKVKMVEPIHLPTREEREINIAEAGYNVFLLHADQVFIDLLTDSGNGAMSANQWSALMRGDEAYAGSQSFYRLESAVRDILGFKYMIPCHQGRGAENILHSALVKPGNIIPGNILFDTTKAHVENNHGISVDCIIDEAADTGSNHPFKGNMDLDKLKQQLEQNHDNIPFVVMTITCNSGGGQPVSIANMRAVKDLCNRFSVPVCVDGARFFENAYFVKQREQGMESLTIREIVRLQAQCFDMMTMSSKKDAIVNIGGFLALRDEKLYEACKTYGVLYEGFVTYGGMSGRDMECIAEGLYEGTDEGYLCSRITQVRFLGEKLKALGIPVVWPPGGHAIYIDIKKFLPHIDQEEFPSVAFQVHLYLEGGIRSFESGTLSKGRDPVTGKNLIPNLELVRLALPRRVYTNSHMEYIAEAVKLVWDKRKEITGYKICYEASVLRSFTARFEPIEKDN